MHLAIDFLQLPNHKNLFITRKHMRFRLFAITTMVKNRKSKFVLQKSHTKYENCLCKCCYYFIIGSDKEYNAITVII